MCFSFFNEKYQYGTIGVQRNYCIGLCNNNFWIGLHWIRDYLEFNKRSKPKSGHPPNILGNHLEFREKVFRCRKSPLK